MVSYSKKMYLKLNILLSVAPIKVATLYCLVGVYIDTATMENSMGIP